MEVIRKPKWQHWATLFSNAVLVSLFLVSCSSTPSESSSVLTADVRSGMNNLTTLKLCDEIASAQYVPLEVTPDNASLIDGVLNYAVTDRYIYVLPVKEPRVVLFDRQGHFVKTLIPFGQGPGEFIGYVTNMQVDEKNNRLYLFSTDRTEVYTLDGESIRSVVHNYQVITQYLIGPDRYASIAMPFVPFQSGSFGIAIFTESGDTIATKNDFYSPLVPAEKSGLTANLAAVYSGEQNSVLFKTGSNDTVFRIAANQIQPACVLSLQNSDEEVIRALDITDFSDLKGENRKDRDIFVSDMFETPARYYFRLRYNKGHCTASVDKKTGETFVEKCEQPASLRELAATTLQHGLLGTKSYQNFPVWGRMEGADLVQIITPAELDYYKEMKAITVPEELQSLSEDGNPVFVFYTLKK